jgi:hypothetical protein
MTIQEAADYTRESAKTVSRYQEEYGVRITPGGSLRFKRSLIDQAMRPRDPDGRFSLPKSLRHDSVPGRSSGPTETGDQE